jgi:hypothetical protein
MGPEPVITNRSATRVTRFHRCPRSRLGFAKLSFFPAPRIPLLSPVAAAVMNRGGGNSSRGGGGGVGGWGRAVGAAGGDA